MELSLIVLWFILPVIFFFLALIQFLEMVSVKKNNKYFKFYVNQFFFTLGCGILTYFVDMFFPYHLIQPYMETTLLRYALLPVCLIAGSKFFGATKPIKIKKEFDRYSKL